MKVIKETKAVEKYKGLAAEMMLADDECEFQVDWIRQHGWRVVPVEDGNHFRPWEVDRIVMALRNLGFQECVAVATEPLDPFSSCFRLSITTDDFQEFNGECGLFRFLLTEDTRSWAISCNELYNLLAGEKSLVEAMLGVSIEEARTRFVNFAGPLSRGDPQYPPLKAARRYAELDVNRGRINWNH